MLNCLFHCLWHTACKKTLSPFNYPLRNALSKQNHWRELEFFRCFWITKSKNTRSCCARKYIKDYEIWPDDLQSKRRLHYSQFVAQLEQRKTCCFPTSRSSPVSAINRQQHQVLFNQEPPQTSRRTSLFYHSSAGAALSIFISSKLQKLSFNSPNVL